MANCQRSMVLQHIHSLVGAEMREELTDGQLLERLAAGQEERLLLTDW